MSDLLDERGEIRSICSAKIQMAFGLTVFLIYFCENPYLKIVFNRFLILLRRHWDGSC
jgi:hypothetical protein